MSSEPDSPADRGLGRPATGTLSAAELDTLVGSFSTLGVELDPGDQRAVLAILGILAGGQPVTARSLARRIDRPLDDVEALIGRLPRLERDDLDRIVGCFGLSLRPTPHALALGHHLAHAWCAWDTLYLPVALDAAAEVTSTCPVSDRTIRLAVTPNGVERCQPTTTVVSFVSPERTSPERVRGEFCALVHFLADADAARRWTEQVPHSFILSVDDAFELGRRTVQRRYGEALGRADG